MVDESKTPLEFYGEPQLPQAPFGHRATGATFPPIVLSTCGSNIGGRHRRSNHCRACPEPSLTSDAHLAADICPRILT